MFADDNAFITHLEHALQYITSKCFWESKE